MQVFGLIGSPVGHSLSPPMHEAAYDALGMDARYVTFEPQRPDLEAAIEGARALGITGLNVTIPYKQAVLDFTEPDDLAERIGAVNTIDFTRSPPSGHNTDAIGTLRALEHHSVVVEGSEVVVVGAGGAGRAIAFALAEGGATVHVANRTESRAHEVADALDGATGHGLDHLASLVPEADLLVNATSVGMEENASPVPGELLHDGLVVFDAVYRPLETTLLREARSAGARTIDGGWMLLYQGVAAFERWTNQSAPLEAMNTALRERL